MVSKQEQSELVTFRRFAKVCPLGVDLSSVEKRNPPEPDICCRLANSGEEVAFELVEIIDRGWARLTSEMFRDVGLLRAGYGSARGSFRDALDAQLNNALVYVSFKRGVTSRKRRDAVPVILEQLAALPVGYEGCWQPPADSSTAETLGSLTISRGRFQGPEFDVEAVSSIREPTVERIRAKWGKRYITPRPVELLAFYELQPMVPEGLWKSRLDSFVEGHWTAGPFRRMWLFDIGSGSISYRAERPGEFGSAA